ncbi:CBS domain-containing protein [Rhizorhabdus histidinilytica]
MKVSDCMADDVRIIGPERSLQEAAQAMAEIDAGVLPVAEGIGWWASSPIVTLRSAQWPVVFPTTEIGKVMSAEVRYCFSDDDSEDVLENMGDIQVRRLPVLNRDKRLVGIVSITDLAAQGEAMLAGEALGAIGQPSALHSQSL